MSSEPAVSPRSCIILIGVQNSPGCLRFLLRALPLREGQGMEANLRTLRSLARYVGAEVRNPKWTSYGALEVDIFTKSRADISLLEAAIRPLMRIEFVHDLDEPPRFLPRRDVVELARSYFNAERFWECHETLESLWRNAKNEEKELQQGLILVAAAYVHLQKDEPKIALGILRRAVGKLRWTERDYLGIDVEEVRKRVERVLESGQLEIFRI